MTTLNQVIRILENNYIDGYSSNAVQGILDKWATQKSSLLSLLRQNPAWNEQELCIVFPVTESREINTYAVTLHKQDIFGLAIDMLDSDNIRDFDHMLNTACSFGQFVNDKEMANEYKLAGIKCNVGQKVSKLINAICIKYGIDKHQDYNRVYAKIADALNPLSIDRKAVLSLHPGDFLLMSNQVDSDGFTSCHRLDDCHRAGTLSYMLDSTSIVFYTVKEDVTENYHMAKKLTRQMFFYEGGLLLQSRLYPRSKKEVSDMYRPLVQKAISDSVQRPNLWTLKREHADIMGYIKTYSGSLHYADYKSDSYNVTLSLIKDIDHAEEILIGHDSLCLSCGDFISDNDKLFCVCCDEDSEKYYCECCEEFQTEELNVVYGINDNNRYVCDSCLADFHKCEHCEIHYTEDLISYDNSDNGGLCEDCISQHYQYCYTCEIYILCYDEAGRSGKENKDGEFVCGDCMDDYSECSHCNEIHLHDEVKKDGIDKVLCADCFDSLYFLCTDCNTFLYYDTNAARLGKKKNDDEIICGNCLDAEVVSIV